MKTGSYKGHTRTGNITLWVFWVLTMFLLGFLFSCGGSAQYERTAYDSTMAAGVPMMERNEAKSLYSEEESMFYPGEEKFGEVAYNPFVETDKDNLSTFGIDVDTGAYTFGRNRIFESALPPAESVRIEEYVNYFNQDYKPPMTGAFSVNVDGTVSPFKEGMYFLRIGIRGRDLKDKERKPWNLTFLIDVSGSMQSRMNLVKESLKMLIEGMQEKDQLSICTYAGGVSTILEPTTARDKDEIYDIIDDINAGGSTAMASGIQNAYNVNRSAFLEEGVNRVIVCSDGDANVGPTGHEQILEMIGEYSDQGITLSTIGFGVGNYNDYLMEQLADSGNGNYYYIDSEIEGRRLFKERLASVMEVIAKDVKIQVEFNSDVVSQYRLIGYENRNIADEDFEKEDTDAGEIGAGHRVTAIYELVLNSGPDNTLGVVHLRYKEPNGNSDIPVDYNIDRSMLSPSFDQASPRLRFTIGVAQFAELLKESPFTSATLPQILQVVQDSHDKNDERDVELLGLVNLVQDIKVRSVPTE